MIKRILKDPVIYFLTVANIGLAYAYFAHIISAETILFTYYFQSLIFGLSQFFQMLTLKEFSVENLKINGRQVEKSNKTKGCLGIFFLMHYGFFHLVYLVFLLSSFDFKVDSKYMLTTLLTFAVGEMLAGIRLKLFTQKEVPNIGTMMFTPYLRVIPIHLFILIGGFIQYDNPNIFSLFIILKIICDVILHIVVNKTYLEKANNLQPPVINI